MLNLISKSNLSFTSNKDCGCNIKKSFKITNKKLRNKKKTIKVKNNKTNKKHICKSK